MDEYTTLALGKRLGISIEDMKQMSFVSFVNILISAVEDNSNGTRKATKEDIERFVGRK